MQKFRQNYVLVERFTKILVVVPIPSNKHLLPIQYLVFSMV